MGQEEEAAAFARPLTCLENLFSVQLWGKALLKHAQAQLVCLEELAKLVQLVISDLSLTVDFSFRLFFCLAWPTLVLHIGVGVEHISKVIDAS